MTRFDRIYIEVSNICNFHCPFCSSTSRAPCEMTTLDLATAINNVKQYTSEVCLHVLGEPLLYSKIAEAFALCRAAELKVNLVTNGYFIGEKLPLLLQYSDILKKVSFSLHSYIYHTNDIDMRLAAIMNAAVTLSCQDISVELRNLSDNTATTTVVTTPAIGVDISSTPTLVADTNALVGKINLFSSALQAATEVITGTQLLDISHNQKIEDKLYYVVKPPFIWPDQSKVASLAVHSTAVSLESLSITNYVASEKENTSTVNFAKVPSGTCTTKGANSNNRIGKLYCQGGKSHIAILSDLTVVPCCLDTAGEIRLGNLNNNSLTELLESAPFTMLRKAFREGRPAHSLCSTCQYASR